MVMSWVLFSILATLFFAITNVVDKYLLTKWFKKPVIPLLIFGIVSLIASGIVYLFNGFAPLSPLHIILSFVSGIFSIFGAFLYFKAVQLDEISRIATLFYLMPLFVLILATIFLNEIFTLPNYIGILLLISGAILISLKRFKLSLGLAFWLIILADLNWAGSLVIMKYLLNFADYWTIFSYTRIGYIFALVPMFLVNFRDFFSVIRKNSKAVSVMSLNQTLGVVADLFLTIAVSIGYVTLVNALSSVQPFFVLLLAVVLSTFYPKILKEEIGRSTVMLKLLAIILMFIGALLIV